MEVIIPKGNLAEIVADDSGATVPSDTISLANLADNAFTAQPATTRIVDQGMLADLAEQHGDLILMQLNPALGAAMRTERRKKIAVQEWAAIVRSNEAAVQRLSNLCSLGSESHEDFSNGSPLPDRKIRLATALEQLRESREELLASVEEYQLAQRAVTELVKP